MTRSCPVCSDGALERFLHLPSVPVLSTAFHDDATSARTAPRGELDLAVCRSCALVWNVAFDPALVDYTPDYENSQHFSPAFRSYVASLAEDLARTYDLHGRDVIEIGSGKGEFLSLLREMSGCRAVGFDPTFDGEISEDEDGIRVVREYYEGAATRDYDPALVIARHVLEHVPDPVGFLAGLRAGAGEGAALYVEVPNAEFVFSDEGLWDLIYQHVGYFSRPTLRVAAERSGLTPHDLRASFHGQFLSLHAGSAGLGVPSTPDRRDVAAVCASIDDFAERLRARLDRWNERLSGESRGSTVLWGAGAKGVAFLNLLDARAGVDRVVDINPRKCGRHVPGTGHEIEPPSALRREHVEAVLVLNRAYTGEIRRQLAELDCRAPVYAV